MKHKILNIFFICILLIIVSSICVNALVIDNPLPRITTTFSEPIIFETIDAQLRDSSNSSIYIEMVNSSTDNKTVQYQPIEYLNEGNYYFRIRAEDIYGNQGSFQIQPFTLTVPSFSISLFSPYFGIAPENPFDATIKTSLPADCRYAYVPKDYEDMNSYLVSSDSFYHALENFHLSTVSTIYFACFSSYKNETASKEFTFSIDKSTPIITSISAQDIAEYPLESELIVKTNNKTVCAYHKNSTNFDEMNLFNNSDVYDINTYKKDNSQILDEEDFVDFSTNTFNVVCMNLAGTKSSVKTISIHVSSQSEAIVSIISPKEDSYQPAGSVSFNITTNKLAKCHFSDNEDEITESGGTFGTFTKFHETMLQLPAGEYTYYFQCLVNTPEGLLDAFYSEFTVDATAPNIIYADDSSIDPGLENLSEFTYKEDQLFLKVFAVDNESGINSYNYSIWQDKSSDFEEDITILNWTVFESDESEESILAEDLSLKDGETYYFIIKAENSAGMWSLEKYSDGITVNLALGNLGHCYNNIQDGQETDTDCGSLCPKCADSESCLVNSDCQSNYCDILSKKCKSSSLCNNGIKDGQETDTDCGGSCSKCIPGNSCIKNSDCQSNYCDQSTKLCISSDTCTNKLLDPGETDTDCGGSCTPCSAGKKCVSDFDCQSAYCPDGVCISSSNCGNGKWDEGEQCDGSTDIQCSLFGFDSGVTSCSNQCTVDTSQCLGSEGICGDETINKREQCDLLNLNDIKCYDFAGYNSGTVSCSNQCILLMDQCASKLNPLQDTDNDGMSDACELKYFNCRTCAEPDEDLDNDKLLNKEECLLCSREGTNPNNPDTDGDGHSDYEEKQKSTSPCDSLNYPKLKLWWIAPLIIILSILGFGYYMYSKKLLIFIKSTPFIKLNDNIRSIKDIFSPIQEKPQEIIADHYKPDYAIKQTQKQENISQKEQHIVKKSSLVKRIMRERKREAAFDSFNKNSNQKEIRKISESDKIKKLPQLNKDSEEKEGISDNQNENK